MLTLFGRKESNNQIGPANGYIGSFLRGFFFNEILIFYDVNLKVEFPLFGHGH
jgi:hypothetical protein